MLFSNPRASSLFLNMILMLILIYTNPLTSHSDKEIPTRRIVAKMHYSAQIYHTYICNFSTMPRASILERLPWWFLGQDGLFREHYVLIVIRNHLFVIKISHYI